MASIRLSRRVTVPDLWEVVWREPGATRQSTRRFCTEQEAAAFAATLPPIGRRGGKGRTVAQRIRDMVVVDGEGCWAWTGRPTNRGYGQIGIRGGSERARSISAHRVSYETFVGPIPDGLVIDHLCRNRLCVNPKHLEPVTQRENVLRSPIAIAALNAAKTHCPQGHPYDEANTYLLVRHNATGRYCRACSRAAHARRSAA